MYRPKPKDILIFDGKTRWTVLEDGIHSTEESTGNKYRWPLELYYGIGNWGGEITDVIKYNQIYLGGE